MTALRLTVTHQKTNAVVGQCGGAPALPTGSEWPRCRLCESEVVAFIDLRLPRISGAPFQAGSRLQIFACREHNDIAQRWR